MPSSASFSGRHATVVRAADTHYCRVDCGAAAAWRRRRRKALRGRGCSGGRSRFSGPLAAVVPANLEMVDCGARGRGLAARRSFKPGEEMARELSFAWVPPTSRAGLLVETPLTTAVSSLPADAVREFGHAGAAASPEILLVAMMLLRSHGDDAMVGDLCEGPQHWLDLPEPRRDLDAKAASVQRLLSTHPSHFVAHAERILPLILRLASSSVLRQASAPAGTTPAPAPRAAALLGLSLLNHNCAPNAELQWQGPEAILMCTQPIAEGEEVTVSYVNELDHVLARRYYLLKQNGVHCLCPRCQANFSGVGDNVLHGWLCRGCGAALREDVITCTCGVVVTLDTRRRREARGHDASQRLQHAMRVAQSGDMSMALPLFRGAVEELQAVRPQGAEVLVTALAFLRACLVRSGTVRAAEAATAELAVQRAAQRAALAREAAAGSLQRAPSTDSWARRLITALRLQEPTEAGERLGVRRRLGAVADGGYVVWDTGVRPLCDTLLSYGVDTNIDFEIALASQGARVLLFDHTVQGLPRSHPNFVFRREALAAKQVPGAAGTIEAHLSGAEGVRMLKADVEGAEFEALLATPASVLHGLDQICMELHWLGRERGGDMRLKALVLERLAEHFVLLHAHGNSYGDVVTIDGHLVPDVLEVLYVNRRILRSGTTKPSKRGIPDPELDANNCPFVPDIVLRSTPFGSDVS